MRRWAPAHLDKGYFFEPTLFVDMKPSMTIAQEEIFGPVGVLLPFHDDDEAVAIANGTAYGLSGSVWSAQPGRAFDVAKRVRSGQLYVNVALGPANPYGPFGGYKLSGLGASTARRGSTSTLRQRP